MKLMEENRDAWDPVAARVEAPKAPERGLIESSQASYGAGPKFSLEGGLAERLGGSGITWGVINDWSRLVRGHESDRPQEWQRVLGRFSIDPESKIEDLSEEQRTRLMVLLLGDGPG